MLEIREYLFCHGEIKVLVFLSQMTTPMIVHFEWPRGFAKLPESSITFQYNFLLKIFITHSTAAV